MVRLVGVVMMVVAGMMGGGVRAQEREATRVAVLDFGLAEGEPAEEPLNGMFVTPAMFRNVMAWLEIEGTDVVVLRVRSSGGDDADLEGLQEVVGEYQKKFRVVLWVEEARGEALMALWGVKEIYCVPGGVIGPMNVYRGCRWAGPRYTFEEISSMMDRLSRSAGRDPVIALSMRVSGQPLSADIDAATGDVSWHPDLSGANVLCSKMDMLTLDAAGAVRFGIAKGIAPDREDLAREMGIRDVEWVGEGARWAIDQAREDARGAYDRAWRTLAELNASIGKLNDTSDRPTRQEEWTKAGELLKEFKSYERLYPDAAHVLAGYSKPEWAYERMLELKEQLEKVKLELDESAPGPKPRGGPVIEKRS